MVAIDCVGCRRSIELTPADNPNDFGFHSFGQRWHYCGCCAESVSYATGISSVQTVKESRYVPLQLGQRLATDECDRRTLLCKKKPSI